MLFRSRRIVSCNRHPTYELAHTVTARTADAEFTIDDAYTADQLDQAAATLAARIDIQARLEKVLLEARP